MAGTTVKPDYPNSEPRPQTRTFAGVRFEDPFQWLEEDSAPVLAWQAGQDALASACVAALPGFAAAEGRIEALATGREVLAPRFGGGRWFRQFVPEDGNLAVIEVSDTPAGSGRRVVDLGALGLGGPATIAWFAPSPDGRKLAFGVSRGGGSSESFRVVDVDTGAHLLDGLRQSRANFPAWLPDGSGFFFAAADSGRAGSRLLIFRHTLGGEPPSEAEPLELWQPISWPVSVAGGRWILVYSDHLHPRPVYAFDTSTGAWRPFLNTVDGMFRGVVLGDRFVAITDDGAPRGRLVSVPLATPTDRRTWRELVPGSEIVLASLAEAGGRLVLLELVDTYARLRVLGPDGTDEGEIVLPGRGVVSTSSAMGLAIAFMDCVVPGAGGEVVFVHSSLVQAPALYRATVSERVAQPLTLPAARLDAHVEDHSAASSDGTAVPYRVVAKRVGATTHPRPTLIFAYGGFNVATVPGWPLPVLAAWVEAGGVLAIAHVRGGGEFGPDWWRAGQLANKQNSFDDLYAVAGDLLERGVAAPAQLGVYGISNGGTLAAVAAVQRAELFGAVVAQLPTTDQFALVRDPISYMIARVEDGDPNDPVAAERLISWSPYQNVTEGVAYPAMLIDCGSSDPRCPAWHGRKLAARLQRATASDRPVLLRVRQSSGHRTVGEKAQNRQQAELLAFFAATLGLTV